MSKWQPIDGEKDWGNYLVTNNIDAKNAYGRMSHLWKTNMIHKQPDGEYTAFLENNGRIHSLTHYVDLKFLEPLEDLLEGQENDE